MLGNGRRRGYVRHVMIALSPLFRPFAALFAAVALFAIAAVPASAQQTVPLGTFNDWWAFRHTAGSTSFCYIGSAPKKSVGANGQRASTYVQITHRPADKSFDVVSVTAGYTYRPGSPVEVKIDGKDYALYTDGGRAWATDAARDVEMVAAMRRGRQMTVRGTSSRGAQTVDTYSLAGFTAARQAIEAACPRK